MEEKDKAVDSSGAATEQAATSTATETEDMETRFKKLEEERENYKAAFLKEKTKNKSSEHLDEDEDEKINRKVTEALANSRLAEIAREQDAIVQRTLKRNKELELALLNKNSAGPATATGTHSESRSVQDTSVTPEQLAYFKAPKPQGLGWTDKEIERYKKNSQRNGR